MSISLKKGMSFNLSKKEPSLQKAMVGLGWEIRSEGGTLDLDVSVFMLTANRKLLSDEYFVFYNNLKSPDGALQHTGDNRTGNDDDDDEIVLVNLSKIHPDIVEILFVVSIHEAETRRHHFGLLNDAYIRIVDVDSKREILRYDLDNEFGGSTDVEFGKLYRQDNEWHFTAIGNGSKKGLEGYVAIYA
jgi:tellurium resistance protein TerD